VPGGPTRLRSTRAGWIDGRTTGQHVSKSRRSGSMRCTRTTTLAATRRVEQLKKAGARLAMLNNDLIR
jgi:hypothetical protein